MNEKLQYAEMLEIPVNTCNITYKPPKKRLFGTKKNLLDEVKAKLVKKVNQTDEEKEKNGALEPIINAETPVENALETVENYTENLAQTENNEGEILEQTSTATVREISRKKKRKISVIGVQLFVIGALIATIFLTSALLPNSGINTFFTSVFKGDDATVETVADNRNYSEFTAVLPVGNLSSVTVNNGVMTLNEKGSVYAPCKGTVSAVTEGEDGKFTLEITHNEKFKTVFSGIDYAYFTVGSEVFTTVPVGYVSGGATACFIGEDGETITNYTLGENGVVWAV